MLHRISILILIHQYILKSILIPRQHIRSLLKQKSRINQQIIKIHRIRLSTSTAISLINLTKIRRIMTLIISIISRISIIRRRQHQMILRIRNPRLHCPRLIHLIIQTHLLNNTLHQRLRICRIINRKLRSKPNHLCLSSQYSRKYRVKRTHPQSTRCRRTNHLHNPLPHLSRRLIRKRQSQNIIRHHTPLKQIRNLIGQDPRLARTRTSHYHRCPIIILHRRLLRRIQQFIKIHK